jgi:hypothetical protein
MFASKAPIDEAFLYAKVSFKVPIGANVEQIYWLKSTYIGLQAGTEMTAYPSQMLI